MPEHPAAIAPCPASVGAALRPVALIGAACGLGGAEDDGGSENQGSAAAPAVLASLGLEEAVRRAGAHPLPWRMLAPLKTGERWARLGAYVRRLAEVMTQVVAEGALPIVLGGDHSIAAGTWRGVGQALGEAPGLIWLDAHLDAHVPASSPTGNPHGMPLAALFGLGAPDLAWVAGPVLDPQRVTVIGARSFEVAEVCHLVRLGVRVVSPGELARLGLARVLAAAVARAGAHGTAPFGVSLDLDVFDPDDAPGTAVPVRDGLAAREVLAAWRGLLRCPNCVALEIAEYSPDHDQDLRTGRLVVALVEAALSAADGR